MQEQLYSCHMQDPVPILCNSAQAAAVFNSSLPENQVAHHTEDCAGQTRSCCVDSSVKEGWQ